MPVNPDNVPLLTVTSSDTKFVDASDRVNVSDTVWPDPTVPDPVRVISTDGLSAFHTIDNATLAVFWFPAASVKLFAATETDAVPDPVAGGVHVAV